jgi:Arc-like DNA binding domain
VEVISMFQEGEVELRARCDQELREKIRDAAEDADRSMSAEIAHRLEKSFERDEAVRNTSPV